MTGKTSFVHAAPMISVRENTQHMPDSLGQEEYRRQTVLFEAQPPITQRFFETQARPVADALIQRLPRVRFELPDEVVVEAPTKAGTPGRSLPAPRNLREQTVGDLIGRLAGADTRMALRQRLAELESSDEIAVAVGAGLLCYAVAIHLVHGVLPAGKAVTYVAEEGEEIPSIPVDGTDEVGSAITAETDAIVEEGQHGNGRGDLRTPFVPDARRFYLPQWVAFDDEGHLLLSSLQEAQAHLASMQQFVEILRTTVSIAPYMVADEEYQRKRYGILGQVINQGRALARYQTHEIIQTIRRRAVAQELNRGLSLSMPYFDDRDLEMKLWHFQVIPAGRIMFISSFIITRAARKEQDMIAHDTRLSLSTRKHLLQQLDMLAQAFELFPTRSF